MRLAVFSDSHGDFGALKRAFLQQPTAEGYIFLGDGEQEWQRLLPLIPPDKKAIQIRGNCDWGGTGKGTVFLNCGDIRILCTHGHRYSVKESLYDLVSAAREHDCQVALFGHTHQSQSTYDNGVYLMNPGSVSRPRDGDWPSYGIVDLTDAGIVCNVIPMR